MWNYWTKNEASFEVPMTFEKVIINFLFEKGKNVKSFRIKKFLQILKGLIFSVLCVPMSCAQMSVCVCVCVWKQSERDWDSINQLGFLLIPIHTRVHTHTKRERENVCEKDYVRVFVRETQRERIVREKIKFNLFADKKNLCFLQKKSSITLKLGYSKQRYNLMVAIKNKKCSLIWTQFGNKEKNTLGLNLFFSKKNVFIYLI